MAIVIALINHRGLFMSNWIVSMNQLVAHRRRHDSPLKIGEGRGVGPAISMDRLNAEVVPAATDERAAWRSSARRRAGGDACPAADPCLGQARSPQDSMTAKLREGLMHRAVPTAC
jgi:hypothetical protein